MAKKNSSKTATEKAIQSSEPRLMSYQDWKGVNFVDSPLDWIPNESIDQRYKHNQTDLPKNYLMVQNNVVTTDTLSLETRPDAINIGKVPNGYILTGVTMVYRKWLFAVGKNTTGNYEVIFYRDLTSNSINFSTDYCVNIKKWDRTGNTYLPDLNPAGWSILEIGFYEKNLVATLKGSGTDAGIFKCSMVYGNNILTIDGVASTSTNAKYISSNAEIPNPSASPALGVVGMKASSSVWEGTVDEESGKTESATVKVEVCYAYTTQYGSSMANLNNPATIYTQYDPSLWSSGRYVVICSPGTIPTTDSNNHTISINTANCVADPNIVPGSGINGIDFYGRDTENTNWVFIGHISVTPTAGGTKWSYIWLGNMTDISQWTNSSLNVPTANDSKGPAASHWSVHDSKIYYWGDPSFPYRLYIGGSPGNEFSVARGLGGAWVDIEPGSGYEIMGTAKWKTVGGANIVTIMCGNSNTNKVKRFNLVETNITITNEISYKGYMYEEVSNVVGCNSRYGYGVFGDGLYSVSRYGLYLTTMAMEYNSQMKNQNISEVIKPIFSERIGTRLNDARMVFIDGIIYLALSENTPSQEGEDPISLEKVILCYDTDNQAWYTFTHNASGVSNPVRHILAIDSDEYQEGLGVVTDNDIWLYPTTGIQGDNYPSDGDTSFDVLIETGELMPKEPKQVMSYIQQIELRFDYFICDPSATVEAIIEGVDYYGREFTIIKKLNKPGGRGFHGKAETVMRDYVEWIRVDRYVESYRMRIKGPARFRLTHWNVKWYPQADVIGSQYGFDAAHKQRGPRNTHSFYHHYIKDYNDLRRAVIA